MTDQQDRQVRQLVVPAYMWKHLMAWLDKMDFVAVLMPMIEDDLPTYVVHPGPERIRAFNEAERNRSTH